MTREFEMNVDLLSVEDDTSEAPTIKVGIDGINISIATIYGRTLMALEDFDKITSELARYRVAVNELEKGND